MTNVNKQPQKLTVDITSVYDERDGSTSILVNGRKAVRVLAVQEGVNPPDGYDFVKIVEIGRVGRYSLYAKHETKSKGDRHENQTNKDRTQAI